MAKACKCDRCGKFFEPEIIGKISSYHSIKTIVIKDIPIDFDLNIGVNSEKYELCKSCCDELKDWLKVSDSR